MSEFNLQETIELLSRTPAALDALLRGLPENWTHRNEGDDSWTVFEVIGHLIHGGAHGLDASGSANFRIRQYKAV
jgi:hypothetical protein